jgi:hypothetical protein
MRSYIAAPQRHPENEVSAMTTSQVEPQRRQTLPVVVLSPIAPPTVAPVGVVVDLGGLKRPTFRKAFADLSDPMLSEAARGWLLGLRAPK